MKILVTADIHDDNRQARGLPVIEGGAGILASADMLIVAGDLANDPERNWPGALERLSRLIEPERIWVIPGNHDYYRFRLDGDDRLAEIAARAGVNFAQKTAIEADGLRLLLCTLWTDFRLKGGEKTAMAAARRGLNDYNFITLPGEHGGLRQIRPEETLAVHLDHRAWLEAELSRPWEGRTVVVTHHCPHPSATGFVDAITPAFTSNLGAMIRKYRPEAWIFGHTHRRLRARVGRTEVRNASLGYPHELLGGMVSQYLAHGLIDTRAENLLGEWVSFDSESIIRTDGWVPFIRFSDVPNEIRPQFEQFMMGQTCPVIDGFMNCAYAHDWIRFCQRYGIA